MMKVNHNSPAQYYGVHLDAPVVEAPVVTETPKNRYEQLENRISLFSLSSAFGSLLIFLILDELENLLKQKDNESISKRGSESDGKGNDNPRSASCLSNFHANRIGLYYVSMV